MFYPPVLLLTLVASLLLALPVHAGQSGAGQHLHQDHRQAPRQLPVSAREAERQNLARLQHELAQMEALIRAAERASQGYDARVNFDYQALRRDLAVIQFAIGEHVNAPIAQPRQVRPRHVRPLKGDYRR